MCGSNQEGILHVEPAWPAPAVWRTCRRLRAKRGNPAPPRSCCPDWGRGTGGIRMAAVPPVFLLSSRKNCGRIAFTAAWRGYRAWSISGRCVDRSPVTVHVGADFARGFNHLPVRGVGHIDEAALNVLIVRGPSADSTGRCGHSGRNRGRARPDWPRAAVPDAPGRWRRCRSATRRRSPACRLRPEGARR